MTKIDPADSIREEAQQEKGLDEVKTFDISGVSMSDFKAIPRRRARMVHPFEGYALKPAIQIGKNGPKVSATHIVGLNPSAEPEQDPSGLNQTIVSSRNRKDSSVVTLKSYHSRIFAVGPSYNEEVVFDREFEFGDGSKILVAVVTRPEHRAQLAYLYDWKHEMIETDRNYLFLDGDQAGRLRQLFQLLLNPKLKKERHAQMVSGEEDATEADLEAIPEGA